MWSRCRGFIDSVNGADITRGHHHPGLQRSRHHHPGKLLRAHSVLEPSRRIAKSWQCRFFRVETGRGKPATREIISSLGVIIESPEGGHLRRHCRQTSVVPSDNFFSSPRPDRGSSSALLHRQAEASSPRCLCRHEGSPGKMILCPHFQIPHGISVTKGSCCQRGRRCGLVAEASSMRATCTAIYYGALAVRGFRSLPYLPWRW